MNNFKEDSRTPRQKAFVEKWRVNGGIGSLSAVTAFGKSYVAVLIRQRMLAKHPKSTCLIVVPKIELKKQWEKDIKKFRLNNTKAIVINSIVNKDVMYNVDLLVVDECHRYASDTFYKVFSLVDYRFILGLTATIERMDGKEVLIKEKAPVLDTVTLQEARAHGWVAPFTEYNLQVPLTRSEAEEYEKNQRNYHYGFQYFQHDFNLAMSCRTGKNPEYLRQIAKEYDIDYEEAYVKSVIWHKAMLKRKAFFIDVKSKIDYIEQIYDKFPRRTIVFSESIDFADAVRDRLNIRGKVAVSYHSKMKAKEKRLAIDNYRKGKYDIICTAKALDEGFSVNDVEVGIVASSTSSGTQTIQRIGRTIRKHTTDSGEEKQAMIINLYVPDFRLKEGGSVIKSQELRWLNKRQKQSNPIWIDSIDSISV